MAIVVYCRDVEIARTATLLEASGKILDHFRGKIPVLAGLPPTIQQGFTVFRPEKYTFGFPFTLHPEAAFYNAYICVAGVVFDFGVVSFDDPNTPLEKP
jgi:hypothetical protein